MYVSYDKEKFVDTYLKSVLRGNEVLYKGFSLRECVDIILLVLVL